MLKIEYKIDKKIDEKLKNKIDEKIDKKIDEKKNVTIVLYEKIKPLFICNGRCSYCITTKCYDI